MITTKVILLGFLAVTTTLMFAGLDLVEAEDNTTRSDMKTIYNQMKSADDIMREQLQDDYLAKNDQLNELIYVSPPRDFVKEWKTIDLQAMDLIEQRFAAKQELDSLPDSDKVTKQAEIDKLDFKIGEIRGKIDKLQSDAIDFMMMDPDAEKKLADLVSTLHNQYDDLNSPFVMAGIDFEQEKITVELTTEFDDIIKFEKSSVAIAERIRDSLGTENVFINVDAIGLAGCSSYTGTCTPRAGGVAIARADDRTNLAGSIGYKAIKNGVTGYVTAGHVVDFYGTGNRAMLQPTNGVQISDGTDYPFTTIQRNGDVSFQKTSTLITDDIYYGTNTKVDIANYATTSSEHKGKLVYKMGAGSGLSWGFVTKHYPITNIWRTTASAAIGDSGGPIFNIEGYHNGQYTGKVFGHTVTMMGGSSVYQPTDKIIAKHGIYPATT